MRTSGWRTWESVDCELVYCTYVHNHSKDNSSHGRNVETPIEKRMIRRTTAGKVGVWEWRIATKTLVQKRRGAYIHVPMWSSYHADVPCADDLTYIYNLIINMTSKENGGIRSGDAKNQIPIRHYIHNDNHIYHTRRTLRELGTTTIVRQYQPAIPCHEKEIPHRPTHCAKRNSIFPPVYKISSPQKL